MYVDLGMQPSWLPERLSGTKTYKPSHIDEDTQTRGCVGIRRGVSEGHVEQGTDVILQPVEASNNVWEISLSAFCNSELTVHTKNNVTAEIKIVFIYFFPNVSGTNRHSHRWGGDWVTGCLTASSPAQEAVPLPFPWASAPHSLPRVPLVRPKIDGGLILGSQFWSLKK